MVDEDVKSFAPMIEIGEEQECGCGGEEAKHCGDCAYGEEDFGAFHVASCGKFVEEVGSKGTEKGRRGGKIGQKWAVVVVFGRKVVFLRKESLLLGLGRAGLLETKRND